MSHCVACDRLLTDKEAVRKSRATGEEIGLCDLCLGYVEEVIHVELVDDSPELDFSIASEDFLEAHPGSFAEEAE